MKPSEVRSFFKASPDFPLVDKLFVTVAAKDFPSVGAITEFLHGHKDNWNKWFNGNEKRYAEYLLLQEASEGKEVDLTEKEKSNPALCSAVEALQSQTCTAKVCKMFGYGEKAAVFQAPESIVERKLRRARYCGDLKEAEKIFQAGHKDYRWLHLHGIAASQCSDAKDWVELFAKYIPAELLFCQSSKGYNPLHIALDEGNLETAEALLKIMPDELINQQTDEGFTALHLALEQGYIGIAQALLEKGASLNKKTENGASAMRLLHRLKTDELAKLVPHMAVGDLRELFERAIFTGNLSKVELLLPRIPKEEFEEPNLKYGWSLLHYAVDSEDVSVVRKILEKTTHRSIKSENDETPLEYAQRLLGADHEITKLLQGAV